MKKLPTYRCHKASGQAITCIFGRTYYLGKFDSPESKKEFARLVAESITNPTFGVEKSSASVAEGVLAYLKYANEYYRAGKEFVGMKDACKPLTELYATLPLSEFGIPQFRACRDWWVKRGVSRGYVNTQAKRLLRIVRWWVAESMVDQALHFGLKCVEPLKRGRCDCPESEPVLPVSQADVDATLKHLPPVLRDMVNLHRLLGCRPGELVAITPAMVNRTKGVWRIEPAQHKTAWRGHSRTIYAGPKAQAILKPYLDNRSPDAPCFSPQEAVEQRLSAAEAERKTPPSCGNVRGSNRKSSPKRKPSDRYTTGTYGRAIRYACIAAKIDVWSPNQLRHSAATALRESEGIESASLILGHKSLDVTQVYAEKSERKAIELAKKHG